MPQRYDAIVIGGGHNGLISAAYLARAGLKTVVLEKRHVLGGAAVTEELFPGFRFSVFSYVVSLLRPEIIRELNLPRHGLDILPLDGTFTPVPEGMGRPAPKDGNGNPIGTGDYLWRVNDHGRTVRELRRWSKMDAEAYEEYGPLMVDMARFIKPILAIVPPDPASIDPRPLLPLTGLLRSFQKLTERQQAVFVQLMTMSAYDFLSQWFETDPLKATMAASGIIGTYQGVKSPGTAYVLLHHYMGEIDGAFRAWGIPKGGTGGISNAIASAARANGVEIRTEAPVAKIRTRGGRATGVVLESGDELEADSVMSSVDVRRTFIDLMEPGAIDADFEAEVRRFKFRGSSGKVNMALDSLPNFTALPGEGEHLRGAISISPSIDAMERAYDDAKYGRFSEKPYIDIIIPTLVDPSMAPPGKHIMSCFVQYAPYNLDPSLGGWDNQREAFGDAVVNRIAEFAPDLPSKILYRNVQTPLDIERTTGLTEGNIFQGELSLEQLFFSRPVPGWARFRTPIRDLWLCGSSTHPGGGIMGANGRIASDFTHTNAPGGESDLRGLPSDPRGAIAMATNWDAVIVGGGHNALVTAAYLAKGGLRTLVLERRERLGGAADTTELGKGIRVPTLAHTVGRLRPSVQKDLALSSHGLSLVAPDVRVFAPSPDGSQITLWSNVARTVAGLQGRSGHDANAYAAFDTTVRALGRFLDELGRSTPPDIKAPGLGDALAALKLGRSFKGLGRDGSRTVLRVLPMAVADLVAESFETDALRAALAWRGVRFGSVGPWSAGTAAMLLGDGAGNDGGAAGETVYAKGGPGALAEALAGAARAAGAEIRTSAEVVHITSRDGRATGVVLAGGEEISARGVVSGVDPKRTVVDLLDPVAVGPSLGWRAGNIRQPGVVAKVNLALKKLPVFPAAGGDESLLRGRIVVAPGIDAMERAFDATKYGRWSESPILEATIPSLADPSLVEGAKAGTHVMSVIAQYAPYDLRGTDWDAAREPFGDAVVSALEGVAPGIGKLVSHRQVLTPMDLERQFGLTGGHSLHAEQGLDQFFVWRPLLGHARYRIALERLYLCGAGAHPGGGITGGPGQNAAREILKDLRRSNG